MHLLSLKNSGSLTPLLSLIILTNDQAIFSVSDELSTLL